MKAHVIIKIKIKNLDGVYNYFSLMLRTWVKNDLNVGSITIIALNKCSCYK